jgi:hypothetical protein
MSEQPFQAIEIGQLKMRLTAAQNAIRILTQDRDLLYDACQRLCRRLEVNELVNRPNTPGNEYDQPDYDFACAAIRKAKGA